MPDRGTLQCATDGKPVTLMCSMMLSMDSGKIQRRSSVDTVDEYSKCYCILMLMLMLDGAASSGGEMMMMMSSFVYHRTPKSREVVEREVLLQQCCGRWSGWGGKASTTDSLDAFKKSVREGNALRHRDRSVLCVCLGTPATAV